MNTYYPITSFYNYTLCQQLYTKESQSGAKYKWDFISLSEDCFNSPRQIHEAPWGGETALTHK